MFRKLCLTTLLVFMSITIFAQESMNDYKYVIVPSEYKFQKEENSYDINELVKFLFNKYGYTVFLDTDSYPDDLRMNECLALTAVLKDDSGMLSTKMFFEMTDCNEEVVYTTQVGKSKEKDYKAAYHQAIRRTFEELKAYSYAYSPKDVAQEETSVTESNTSEKVVASSVAVASATTNDVEPTATSSNSNTEPSSVSATSANNTAVASGSSQTAAAVAAAPLLVANPVEKTIDQGVLYAQEIENGYQLVDSTPKVVYKALATSVKDVYLIKDADGIIYKTADGWVAEFYEDGQLKRILLTIKLL